MLSIAEWTDRAFALSSPMKLTSSASFSPSIRISPRLKINQAQAKNFCRVLDIRVTKIVIPDAAQTGFFQRERKILCDEVWLDTLTDLIHIDVIQKFRAIRAAANLAMFLLFRFQLMQQLFKRRNKR